MNDTETLGEMLARRGFGRRSLLKFAIAMTSSLALPPAIAPVMAANLAKARRRSVIWLSFQGMHGLPGDAAPFVEPDHRLAHLRLHFARLPGNPDGSVRRSGGADAARRSGRQQG
ncbi:MAG: hypothetical protein WDN49_04770 [Acetobacteraceae bacterium]